MTSCDSVPRPPPSVLILADDLTGACDAAAPFAARGVATEVRLQPTTQIADGVAVRAVDADTRRLSRRLAVARTAEAARLTRVGREQAYKKIDSTLRGHVAAELGACMRVWDMSLAIVAPAFPALGRWIQDGRLHVDGRGEIGAVAELAGFGRGARLGHLTIGALERDPEEVAQILDQQRQKNVRVVIADANAPGHLTALAEAATHLHPAPLLVGSAGLAAALAQRGAGSWGLGAGLSRPPTPSPQLPAPGPWLVVAGSQAEVTRLQVTQLERAGARVIALPVEELLGRRPLARTTGEQAARALADGITPVLRLLVPPDSSSLGRRSEERAARALARSCRAVVEREVPAGLFLTGGLTARACLLALGASGLRLDSEPLPGIAGGRAIAGTWDGRPVVTKAGGFGAPDAIRRLVLPTS